MTPEEQRVREAIAKGFSEHKFGHCPANISEAKCADLSSDCNLCWADQTLNLKYESGTPMLAVLDENQELPTKFGA